MSDEVQEEEVPKKPVFLDKKELAQHLWERLGKSRPGPEIKDLIFIARFVPMLSSSAVKTLMGRKLSLAELKELIEHVPKATESAAKLALQLYQDELEEDDLKFLVSEARSTDAAKMLLKRFPSDPNLNLIDNTIDSLKDAVKKVREQEPTRDVLRDIERKL